MVVLLVYVSTRKESKYCYHTNSIAVSRYKAVLHRMKNLKDDKRVVLHATQGFLVLLPAQKNFGTLSDEFEEHFNMKTLSSNDNEQK